MRRLRGAGEKAQGASEKNYWLDREKMNARMRELDWKQVDLVVAIRGRGSAISQSSITRARRSDAGVGIEHAKTILRTLYGDERPFFEMIADYGGEVVRKGPTGGSDVEGDHAGRGETGRHVRKEAVTRGAHERNTSRRRDFFVLGCGVGDGANLIPPPCGPDDGALEGFFEILFEVAPSRYEEILRLKTMPQDAPGEAKLGFPMTECVDMMSAITEVVRCESDEGAYSWYKLGLLLRALRMFSVLLGRDGPRATTAADALDILVGQSHFWPRLEDRVRALVQSVRGGGEVNDLADRIDALTESLLDAL